MAKLGLHFIFRFGENVTGERGKGKEKKKKNCKFEFEGGEGCPLAAPGGAAAGAPGGDSRSRSAP